MSIGAPAKKSQNITNWWKFRSDCSEQYISRSAFVTVVENDNGLVVSDLDVEVATV